MFLFKEIAMDFYQCTSVPITVVNKTNNIVFNYGHSPQSTELFNKYNIFYELNRKKDLSKCFNIKLGKVYFPIITIYTKCQIPLYFILGPLKICENTEDGLINLKSEICIDYLAELLLYISKDKLLTKFSECTYSPFVSNSIKYIEENYSESIAIDDICATLNINKCYFCNIFKKETGETFITYLNKYRIDKSKELLKGTSFSLLDIALLVGFKNQSYFSTTFKKINGTSPLDFRLYTNRI